MTINNVTEVDINSNINSTENKITKIREAIPQILAVTGKNFLLITLGTTLGFPTILLAALQNDYSDINVTRDEITWMSSIHYFMMPVGCILSGPISNYLGRRRTMILANIPFIISWIIIHFATAASHIFIALALMGLTGGLCEAPVLTYVAEVTQPHLRGVLSSTATLAVIAGVFSQMLAGTFTDWKTVTLINLIYPIICFMGLLYVPESPYWLASKNQMSNAEKSLRWLRGWTSASHVSEELQIIRQMVIDSTDCNSTVKKNSWCAFKKRTFISPFILTVLAFFIASFGGASTLQTYAVYIFIQMHVSIDRYTATIFLGIAETLGTIICVIVIHFTGKRRLCFVSVGGTGTLFLSSAIYSYLTKLKYIDADNYLWLPMTCLIGAAFFSHIGIRLLPWILVGEVFPALVRSTASGVTAAIYYIFLSIANKIFLYMVDKMELSGTFMFYTTINFIGGIILFFLLPETEGCALKEIENYYAGVGNFRIESQIKQISMKKKRAVSNPVFIIDNIETEL